MREIADRFRLTGTPESILPFGGGHINDTYRLVNPHGTDYLLQRINHRVFPDVEGLMRNITLVTDHLRTRLTDGQTTPTVIPSTDGQSFYRAPDGNYWRVFEFLGGLHSYEVVGTPAQAYEGAKSYGYFLRSLEDLPADRLTAVIPGFHDLPLRLRQFASALASPAGNRAGECRADIARVHALADDLLVIDRLHKDGSIPRRVTHNDTKFNNVLLTPDDRGRCVVDLDTVMPGIVHFDFGDGVRSGVSPVGEDEADLSRVTVDVEKFRGFAAGYLEVTRDVLSETEIAHLARSGAYMAYIMGVRFLTDYLAGDVYYKISHPGHNLLRARNQLRLTEEFLARLPELDAIVRGA